MKKLISWIIMGAVVIASVVAPAPTFAAGTSANNSASAAHIEDTIRALGIMTGDSNGNLGLNRYISRAEFAQMMVNASQYKASSGLNSGTSLFKDVKYDYWAAASIRAAVQAGWFTGYLDGTFKPTRQITLEEGATALLKLLGYTNADLVGSYPSAQLSKFYALGLSERVKAKQGEKLTREDAMFLFYTVMHTETKAGQIYAQTQGHPMLGGEIDYALLVQSVTQGPFILDQGDVKSQVQLQTQAQLQAPYKVYRNGKAASMTELLPYDVYYTSKNMRTVWAYSQKVTGLYTGAIPSSNAPSTVVVAGSNYAIGSSEAAFALSTNGKFGMGETVTLLLGMHGDVVGVHSPDLLNETLYGVVTAYEPLSYLDRSGKLISENSVKVASTDGTLRQIMVGGLTFTPGNLVSVTYTNTESVVTLLNTATPINTPILSGQVNAEGIEIMDVNYSGDYVMLYPNRLAGVNLMGSDVRYYTLDSAGKVDRLILNNVTGDLNTYGIVTNVTETTTVIDNVAPIPDTVIVNGLYETLIKGIPGVLRTSDRLLGITEGPAWFTYNDGNIANILTLGGVNLTSINAVQAMSGTQAYGVAQDVQVYQRIGGKYFTVNINTISNTHAFTVMGYRDSGYRLGGLIRVIVATQK